MLRPVARLLAMFIAIIAVMVTVSPSWAQDSTQNGIDNLPEGFPRADGWLRPPSTWRADTGILYHAIGTTGGTVAFDAFQPNNGPDLVDSNYVEAGTLNAYPSVISINNNFGASAGDTVIIGGFRAVNEVVWSMYAAKHSFQDLYDNLEDYEAEHGVDYGWLVPLGKTSGKDVSLYVQPGCRGAWSQNQVWHSDQWPLATENATGPNGEFGWNYEWRGFDLTTAVRAIAGLDEYCLVLVLENPEHSGGSIFTNLTWLADNWTSFAVSAADPPVPDQASVWIGPNPTRNRAMVGGLSVVDPLDQVEVFDLTGRRVMESKTPELDLSGLSPGLYLVRIWTVSGATWKLKLTRL